MRTAESRKNSALVVSRRVLKAQLGIVEVQLRQDRANLQVWERRALGRGSHTESVFKRLNEAKNRVRKLLRERKQLLSAMATISHSLKGKI